MKWHASGDHLPFAEPRKGSRPCSRQRSSVLLGGRRLAVERPRVRSVTAEKIALPTSQAVSALDDELVWELALVRMLAGLSNRKYPIGLEPVGTDLGSSATSRSAVSRRFVARTQVPWIS